MYGIFNINDYLEVLQFQSAPLFTLTRNTLLWVWIDKYHSSKLVIH